MSQPTFTLVQWGNKSADFNLKITIPGNNYEYIFIIQTPQLIPYYDWECLIHYDDFSLGMFSEEGDCYGRIEKDATTFTFYVDPNTISQTSFTISRDLFEKPFRKAMKDLWRRGLLL